MPNAVIALGSNLGDSAGLFNRAVAALNAAGVRVIARSALYESAPALPPGYSGPPHGRYLNAAVLVETILSAPELLARCMETERSLGRDRRESLSPRPIDLDLIFFDRVETASEELTLPHPRWRERDFVLAPILDLIAEHPERIPAADAEDVRRLSARVHPHVENRRQWF